MGWSSGQSSLHRYYSSFRPIQVPCSTSHSNAQSIGNVDKKRTTHASCDWRKAKKVGCEKGYNGWSFFSTSTNSAGYDLYEEIKKLTADFDNLMVTERQL